MRYNSSIDFFLIKYFYLSMCRLEEVSRVNKKIYLTPFGNQNYGCLILKLKQVSVVAAMGSK